MYGWAIGLATLKGCNAVLVVIDRTQFLFVKKITKGHNSIKTEIGVMILVFCQ